MFRMQRLLNEIKILNLEIPVKYLKTIKHV